MNRASIEKARERQRNSNYASTEEKVDSDGRNDGEVTSGPRARVDKRSSLERRINQTSLFATYQF